MAHGKLLAAHDIPPLGSDGDTTVMVRDEVLQSIAKVVKNIATIYVDDIKEVPDFNNM